MKTHVAVIIIVIGVAIAAMYLLGCFSSDKTVEAASGYEAQQLACIDRYAYKPSIDKCRDAVKAAWAVTDAGKDGDR